MSDKPVERFDLGYSFYDCPEMQSSETGGYVEFAAYESLQKENEVQAKRIAELEDELKISKQLLKNYADILADGED